MNAYKWDALNRILAQDGAVSIVETDAYSGITWTICRTPSGAWGVVWDGTDLGVRGSDVKLRLTNDGFEVAILKQNPAHAHDWAWHVYETWGIMAMARHARPDEVITREPKKVYRVNVGGGQ